MGRRIVIAMLALIGTLLVTAVVPLGLLTTSRERGSFRDGTVLSARALAAVAEESLADHSHGPGLALTLSRIRQSGDCARVYGASGALAATTAPAGVSPPPIPPAVLSAVLHRGGAAGLEASDWLSEVVSIRSVMGGREGGAVVLSRSTSELEERLRVLWAWLSLVAAAGLAAAVAAAAAFARWVARPLSVLDAAAGRLGAGALDTRSAAGNGPPEVRRLARTFNTMAARLEALVHGHRAMMADVSHQLRTPLAALRLRLDVLAQDADPVTADELAGAQDEIARLSRLVDGLLAVARAENVVAEPVPADVGAVLRDRVAAWRPVAEERGVTLTAYCPAPLTARLGEGHLEQVLDNLLANALDAVPPGGHVSAAGSGGDWGVRVTVADDGPGMTDAQQQAAFRRFASTTPGGAGLGLAIVHRLVTANGGSAKLSHTPGGGLTVTLELERHDPALPGTRAGREP